MSDGLGVVRIPPMSVMNLMIILTAEPNMTSFAAPAWFPAWSESMAYRPRGLSSTQITVLVASFFVALGAGTNYVRRLTSLLNNWTNSLLDIFRCLYSFCFRWNHPKSIEFHLHVAYSPQLGARLNISYTLLNIIGLAGNGKQFFFLHTPGYIFILFYSLFSRGVYNCSDLGEVRGLAEPSGPFCCQFSVPPVWIFWHQAPIWFWPTARHKYSANS